MMSHHNRIKTTKWKIKQLQTLIEKDLDNRGMKSLIVPGDLYQASQALADIPPGWPYWTIVILSGFPCCVMHDPPTETDGPTGACALARTCMAFAFNVVIVTDVCNQAVFAAAVACLVAQVGTCAAAVACLVAQVGTCNTGRSVSVSLECFPPSPLNAHDQKRLDQLAQRARLMIAIERPGPGLDGNCYTMRGINMNKAKLIAPLHELIAKKDTNVPFVAIGDGGNELGMGKVLNQILDIPRIHNACQVACVVAADHLIASSVSNWGGYALAASAALLKADEILAYSNSNDDTAAIDATVYDMIARCLPTEEEEIQLLEQCVAAGCRDGVTGSLDLTVNGLPLQVSLQCLRDIRAVALS